MATIQDFLNWYKRDLGHFAPHDTHVWYDNRPDVVGDPRKISVKVFTDNNAYTIVAREGKRPSAKSSDIDAGFLGCGGGARKPRAGEDWTRGNDLADGPFTEETWRRILADIVSFELVRVHDATPPQVVDEQLGVANG